MESLSSSALLKIVQVINKTLAFHTSVNYQLNAPEPFTADVHEDLLGDLARIEKQSYRSDYDLHIDLSRTLKRLNDGHCVWIDSCYVRISKQKNSHDLRADARFDHRIVCCLLPLPIYVVLLTGRSPVALFTNFIPTPLALLTDKDGSQSVHISPEAFLVASAEFPDQIDVWQNALPGPLKGKLDTVRDCNL